MKLNATVVWVLFTALGAASAPAQSPSFVQPGTRLRVMTVQSHFKHTTGVFVESGNGDLVLRAKADHVERIPLDNITKLERSTSRSHRPVQLAVGSAIIGSVIGALAGPRTVRITPSGVDLTPCSTQTTFDPQCPSTKRTLFSAKGAENGAMIGGGIGFMLGVVSKTDTWRQLSVDELPRRVSVIAPGRALGVSITF